MCDCVIFEGAQQSEGS